MRPDIVLLDLGLPGMSGLTVLEALRGWTDVPIIVLTARDEERSKVLALDAGADDYVTKPFGMAELLARVRAALRRAPGSPADIAAVQTEQFELDLAAHRAFVRSTDSAGPRPRSGSHRSSGASSPTSSAIPTSSSPTSNSSPPCGDRTTNPTRTSCACTWATSAASSKPTTPNPTYFITDAGVGYRFQPDA